MQWTGGAWIALLLAISATVFVVEPRFKTNTARAKNGDDLYGEIRSWTAQHTKYEAMETIASAGVPCSACLDTAEIHHDKHLLARDFIHELDLPVHGKVPMLGFAPKLSASKVAMKRPPRLGEHTDTVLASELGLAEEQITRLRDSGIIGDSNRFS